MLTIRQLRAWATKNEPIYIQLYLDKCFWCKQDMAAFTLLTAKVDELLYNSNCSLLTTWVKGTDDRYDGSDRPRINIEEYYWTTSWAKVNAKSWIDRLPLPKRHAKKFNAKYKSECKKEYLMLDYYELD